MTPTVAAEFAAAFGTFLRERSGGEQQQVVSPLVCVGRDSRPSGAMLASAAMAGLTAVGCRVIDLGVAATPSVAVMVLARAAAGGLVVTASHNPLPWNGLKCILGDGASAGPSEIAEIIRRFKEKQVAYVSVRDLQPAAVDASADEVHVNRVLTSVDPHPIRDKKFKVVLDSVNGAGGSAGRRLLEALGCEVVHLYAEPTGLFPHGAEPLEENLTDLAERTAREGAAVGFAQDPDADRLAIVDERGRYIGEEYTLALAARRILEHGGAGPLVANLSTSRMIDDVAARCPGATVIRTAVGEANVAAAMRRHDAVTGGEGNGGVIYPPVCWVRDSISSMALILDLLAVHGRPLSAIVADLPRYAMIKHKFDLSGMGGLDAVDAMIDRVAHRLADHSINRADGVRVDFPDGWVHLRASNTEPIVRLIAEAPDADRAWALLDEVGQIAGLSAPAKR